MPVYYNAKKIIPAPFIAIEKEEVRAEDDSVIGAVWVITVTGKIIAYKGSPTSSGTFWTASGYPSDENLSSDQYLASLLRKQQALSELFCTEGATFEVQPWDGSAPLKCNPIVRRGPTYQAGEATSWYNDCDYTIVLEADTLYLSGTQICAGSASTNHISQSSEEWNIEAGDEYGRTYRLTHNVSAKGRRFYDDAGSLTQAAWKNAQDYVLNVIGLGLDQTRVTASGVINGDNLVAYNYLRANNVNEKAGTFSCTETWLCYDPQGEPPAIDEFTVDATAEENGRTRVSVQGQIKGLTVRDNTTYAITSSGYANAYSKWASYVQPYMYARAVAYSNVVLNATPVTFRVSSNVYAGTIGYTYDFDNRPNRTIANSLSETVTVNDGGAADVFAVIPVIGRPAGPVLQNIGSTTERRRTINIEVQMPTANQVISYAEPSTTALLASYIPSATQVFLAQDEKSWSPTTGRYSRTVTYVWQ